jgi:phosphoglycolate phosphatase-like HAD superfamily hydrolase
VFVRFEAAITMRYSPGTIETLEFLSKSGPPIGLLTRNSEKSMNMFINRLETDSHLRNIFHVKISREFQLNGGFRVKPHPYSLEWISDQWKIAPNDLLMVGDSHLDIECGHLAKTRTALLLTHEYEAQKHKFKYSPDYFFEELSDLVDLVKMMND